MVGTPLDIAVTLLVVIIGIALFAVAMTGYLFRKLWMIERLLFGAVSLAIILVPLKSLVGLPVHLAALIVLLGLIWWIRRPIRAIAS